MIQFKYIATISEKDFNDNVVIPCIDEDGFSCILIRNSKNKCLINSYTTDNLSIKLNAVLTKFGNDFYFHIIKAKKTDFYTIDQFETIYNYIFKKIEEPQQDVELYSLVVSIEDFFKTTPEKNNRELQIGVFGELLVIKHLYECGYKEIVNKYHKDFYSKHDIEINALTRLEVKTTSLEKRIHHFKHNQICRNDVEVIVASVILEESKEGYSLKELFSDVIPLFTNPDSVFALKKLYIRCGLTDEYDGLSFSYNKALNDIAYYNSKNLPKINQTDFDGVFNIEYDVDCASKASINVFDLIEKFKSI